MKGKFFDHLKNLTESIKKSRKLQIGLAILVAFVIILCYLLFIRSPSSNNNQDKENQVLSNAEIYAQNLEDKLEDVLSQIKGAGEVKVLINLGSGFEYVYAMEEEIKQTSSGTITSNSIVLVSGEPVLIKQIYPKISGVIVAASGADDISVKVNLITAIQTVIDVENKDITILTKI